MSMRVRSKGLRLLCSRVLPVDKKEAVDEEEIKRRAANFGDGQKDPYGVLKLPKDSQMTDIRKAYRRFPRVCR